MKRALTFVIGVVSCAVPAVAGTVLYGWEDGGTILGKYGNVLEYNVGVPDPVYAGDRSLKLVDMSSTGPSTPQAYVAWIVGLQDGDQVEGKFWRYDTTPGASPSCRIWGHWNDDPNNVMGFNGSAGGNEDYGPGTGWDETSWVWTVSGGHTGLVIEIRTYSTDGDTVWIDNMTVTAPAHASIYVAPEPGSLVLLSLAALLIRRR